MEVFAVRPSGYCSGVLRAIAMAKKAAVGSSSLPVYCLGALVHNEETLRELNSLGIQTISGNLEELERFLLSLPPHSGTIVFSAHGHPARWESEAMEKGLNLVDCTCPVVEENCKMGMSLPAPFAYFGLFGHAESEAFLANCPKAVFFDVTKKSAFPSPSLLPTPCPVITQTTLSQEEIEMGLSFLENQRKEPFLLRSRCASSKVRQEAVDRLPKDTSLLLVLGSATSNNSRKLVEKAMAKGIKAILITDRSELKRIRFPEKGLALACGASTSPQEFEEVLQELRSL